MTIPLIQYAFPALVGYALFMTIAGKINPFSRPALKTARPKWFLGVWVGTATMLTVLIAIQMVNPLALDTLTAASAPLLALLILACTPGLVIYAWYHKHIREVLSNSGEIALAHDSFITADFDFLQTKKEPDFKLAINSNQQHLSDDAEPKVDMNQTLNLPHVPTTDSMVYDQAFEREYSRLLAVADSVTGEQDKDKSNTEFDNAYEYAFHRAKEHFSQIQANANNAASPTPLGTVAENQITEIGNDQENTTRKWDSLSSRAEQQNKKHKLEKLAATDESEQLQLNLDHKITSTQESHTNPILQNADYNNAFTEAFERAQALQAAYAASEAIAKYSENADRLLDFESILAQELSLREQQVRAEVNLQAKKELKRLQEESQSAIATEKELTENERNRRMQTEMHLRVTRRALARLEANSRQLSETKTERQIALERELEEKIRITSKSESALAREIELREKAEKELIDCKKSELAARSNARKNTAARAKILTTAQKAMTFARQTVDARTQIESELQKAKEQINLQKATISSLIETLEKEKSKSREEVSYLCKQLMKKEIELEKKSINAGNLTSKLVKKVARAKPIAKTA